MKGKKPIKATEETTVCFVQLSTQMAKENRNCFTMEQYMEIWKSLGFPWYKELWSKLQSYNFVQKAGKKGYYKIPPSLKTTPDDINRVLEQTRRKLQSYKKICKERKNCKTEETTAELEHRIQESIELLKKNGYKILKPIEKIIYEEI